MKIYLYFMIFDEIIKYKKIMFIHLYRIMHKVMHNIYIHNIYHYVLSVIDVIHSELNAGKLRERCV